MLVHIVRCLALFLDLTKGRGVCVCVCVLVCSPRQDCPPPSRHSKECASCQAPPAGNCQCRACNSCPRSRSHSLYCFPTAVLPPRSGGEGAWRVPPRGLFYCPPLLDLLPPRLSGCLGRGARLFSSPVRAVFIACHSFARVSLWLPSPPPFRPPGVLLGHSRLLFY